MPVLLVIPARYASTRFPGKPLVDLRGASGEARSLIRRSWEAAREVPGVDRIVVATDDARIADAAEAFGAEVAMTPETCRNGTERCAAVAKAFGPGWDVIVNLQGDAPLTPPWFVGALIEAMAADPGLRGRDPGAALRRRRRWRAFSRTAATAGSAAPPRCSTGPDARSTSPRRSSPTPAGRSARASAYRSFTMSASTPIAGTRCCAMQAGTRGPSRPGKAWSSCDSWRTASRCAASRWTRAGRAFWELNNPADIPRLEAILAAQGMA